MKPDSSKEFKEYAESFSSHIDLEKRPLSYSSLKAFKKSPRHYIAYLLEPRKMTAALRFGTLFHGKLLEPFSFEENFILEECYDRRTTEGKARWDEYMVRAKGKTIYSSEDLDLVTRMIGGLEENADANSLLAKITNTERQLTWEDKELGLRYVSYVDGDGDDKRIMMDVKTIDSAAPEDFIYQAMKYDYPLQNGMYLEGFKKVFFAFPDCYYLVAEKKTPFRSSVLRATDRYIEYGKAEFEFLTKAFRYCLDNDLFWQGYEFWDNLKGKRYHDIDVPRWKASKYLEVDE